VEWQYVISSEYKDRTRDVIEQVTIRLAISHYLPIGDPLEQSLYLQPFFEILATKCIGVTTLTFQGHLTSSVKWPFDSHVAISYRRSIVTKSLSPAICDWLIEHGFTSAPTQYRLYQIYYLVYLVIRPTVFTGLMTQPTASKHWRRVVSHPDRTQSNQSYITVLQHNTTCMHACRYNTRK